MRLLLRSAVRTWRRRPAGPALLLAGVLVATLLVAGGDLALESAREGAREADRTDLGDELGRVWTPGGYTPQVTDLQDVRSDVVAGPRAGLDPPKHQPIFLERSALVTDDGETTAGWTVVGLEAEAFRPLGLPTPSDGEALVDPAGREAAPSGDATIRVQRTPERDAHLRTDRLGELAFATRQPDGTYTHSDDDRYEFSVEVFEGAERLTLNVTSPSDDTDFDLEAEAPNGTTYLDDDGTTAQPDDPALNISAPGGGNWTVRVHAKAAQQVSFRLGVDRVYSARDAQALGRLLEGAGFRAVGAKLGFTEQVTIPASLQPADLHPLGPGPQGLVVLPLDRMQSALDVDGRASGFRVLAADGRVLDGMDPGTREEIEAVVADARSTGNATFEPLRGLTFEGRADRAQIEREAALESTGRLLDVVLPSGVAAGLLLATWASGLHARRLRDEVRVLAALGQDRRRSALLVALHLGPALVAGAAAALALSPLVGQAVARGTGLPAADAGLPGTTWLLAPLAGGLLVAGAAATHLREAVRGGGNLRGTTPPTPRRRLVEAGGLAAAALLLGGVAALGGLDPARSVRVGAGAAAAGAAALLWSPLLEPILARARSLGVPTLGFYRTRSTHRSLGLAAGAVCLVIASLVAGAALEQAASPDPLEETGGYEIVAEAPAFVEDLDRLFPEEGSRAGEGRDLVRQVVAAEVLMRTSGIGLHDGGGPRDVVYGLDSSFGQRHRHALRAASSGQLDPFRAVAGSPAKAVVSPDVADDLQGGNVSVRGPGGSRTFEVVGVVETRLVPGVYVSKDAFPVLYRQFAGEVRLRLPAEADASSYARELQDAARSSGLQARTAQDLADDRLEDQRRAGRTLAGLGTVGAGAALLVVGLLGVRARADRRLPDAVLLAQGARPWCVAAGLATEVLLPLLVGSVLAVGVVVPLAAGLDGITGLAFPLSPVDAAGLRSRALLVVATLAGTGALLAGGLAFQAVRGRVADHLRDAE
jgi:hypothetical protein